MVIDKLVFIADALKSIPLIRQLKFMFDTIGYHLKMYIGYHKEDQHNFANKHFTISQFTKLRNSKTSI